MGKTVRSTRSGAGRSSKDNTRSAKPKARSRLLPFADRADAPSSSNRPTSSS